jgi:hypothetical protein
MRGAAVAIYRLEAKVIGRTSGRSATAAAAYRAAERIADERTGQVHDYARRGGVEHAEILAPANAPAWVQDRAALWNAVEVAETRRNAQLARELVLTLPRELTPEQRLEAVRGFVSTELVSQGMVADITIHTGRTASDGAEQPHAHVMLTLRGIGPEGFAGNKVREWNEVAVLDGWRERWGTCLNQALEGAELSARVDHRSLEAQRAEAQQMANQARANGHEAWADQFTLRALELDRRPEPKLGVAARLEARGIATEQGVLVREVRAEREERRSLVDELRGWLTEKARQVAERAHAFKDALRERLAGLAGADLSSLRQANLEVALARSDRGQEHLLTGQERSQVVEHRTAEAERQRQAEQERARAQEREGPRLRRVRSLGLER